MATSDETPRERHARLVRVWAAEYADAPLDAYRAARGDELWAEICELRERISAEGGES